MLMLILLKNYEVNVNSFNNWRKQFSELFSALLSEENAVLFKLQGIYMYAICIQSDKTGMVRAFKEELDPCSMTVTYFTLCCVASREMFLLSEIIFAFLYNLTYSFLYVYQ